MNAQINPYTEKILLEWQIDLGATEAILDEPVNRYKTPNQNPKPQPSTSQPLLNTAMTDPVAVSQKMAAAAQTLDGLCAALAQYEHCELKQGARNLVFCDGVPEARVMIIGEAPGRDEDRQGRPFVGRAGKLLDAMFAAIHHGRTDQDNPLYIANIIPWRPPQNRDPKPDEIAMMLPFVKRHIELAAPEVIVLMGNISCQALLGRRGITRLRGHWSEVMGRPALPMFHPAYLLRNPIAKREAWLDLLSLQTKMRS